LIRSANTAGAVAALQVRLARAPFVAAAAAVVVLSSRRR